MQDLPPGVIESGVSPVLQESPHHGGVVVQAGHVEGRDAVLSLLVTDRYTPGQKLSGCYASSLIT